MSCNLFICQPSSVESARKRPWSGGVAPPASACVVCNSDNIFTRSCSNRRDRLWLNSWRGCRQIDQRQERTARFCDLPPIRLWEQVTDGKDIQVGPARGETLHPL